MPRIASMQATWFIILCSSATKSSMRSAFLPSKAFPIDYAPDGAVDQMQMHCGTDFSTRPSSRWFKARYRTPRTAVFNLLGRHGRCSGCRNISSYADDALKAAADGFVGPIVFVDDFVGSGEQFLSTWERPRTVPGHGQMAFKDLPPRKGRLFAYCSVMVTEQGRNRIAAKHPPSCSYREMCSGDV